MALNWKAEYIALLSRLYREKILKVATAEGYLKANGEIGRAAHVRPLTVERWIEGIGRPNPAQAERLMRWAGRVGWWEWIGTVDMDDKWRRVTIAEELHELIRASRGGG